jgi:plastocyanin
MRKLVLLLAVLVLSVFGLAACGDDDDEESADTAATTTEETEPAGGGGDDTGGGGGGATGGGETVEVSADPGGALAFEQSSLEATAGSVTFSFDNPASLTHDFCLEDEGGGEIGCTDQIAGSMADLTEDLQPGTYTYFCSVSGHREGGMEGELTVN